MPSMTRQPQPTLAAGLPPPLGASAGTPWERSPAPRTPGPERWEAALTTLPGVGRATAERAATMGLRRVGDLLEHLPVRYLAYDEARRLRDVAAGQEATVRVRLDPVARCRPSACASSSTWPGRSPAPRSSGFRRGCARGWPCRASPTR